MFWHPEGPVMQKGKRNALMSTRHAFDVQQRVLDSPPVSHLFLLHFPGCPGQPPPPMTKPPQNLTFSYCAHPTQEQYVSTSLFITFPESDHFSPPPLLL